jgi:protein SCO1/2
MQWWDWFRPRTARVFGPALGLALAAGAAGCAKKAEGRRYEVKGQVLQVSPERREVVLRHEDIPGFMPAMTMPFTVRPPSLLAGRTPGDRVVGTLVVTDDAAWLERLAKVGFEALPSAPADPAPEAGALAIGAAVPDAAFVDQEGAPRRLVDYRGRALAITFIFTRCPLPEFCPALDRSFARLQGLVKEDPALREKARLVSVSFDPAHDTPAVLRAHAGRLGADPGLWTFVTGEEDVVDALGRSFGLSVDRADAAGLTHNLRTAVVDPRGRLFRTWRGSDFEPQEVAEALRAALRAD